MLTPAPGDTLADTIGKAAQGLDPTEPLTFVRHLAGDDVYHRGPKPGGVLFVIPGLWSGMPARLLAVMRARRAASCTGRCPICDTAVALATGTHAHEPGCPVADEHLIPMVRAWVRTVGCARGRRLQETLGA